MSFRYVNKIQLGDDLLDTKTGKFNFEMSFRYENKILDQEMSFRYVNKIQLGDVFQIRKQN